MNSARMRGQLSFTAAVSAILSVLTPARCWAAGAATVPASSPNTCVTSKCHGGIKSGKVVHDPVKTEGCNVCHGEGGGKNPKLPKGHPPAAAIQRSEVNELCLGCHDNIRESLAKANAHKHKPVADGGCLDCHVAHAGENRSLLTKPYTDQFYVAYDDGNYALCFECHDSALATKPLATDETGFRNGEQNLHFLHIQDKRKGRSCRACHDVHAAENSKLVSRWVPFKGLKIPLQYTGTPTGGNCVTACHGLKKYDRVKAAANEKGR